MLRTACWAGLGATPRTPLTLSTFTAPTNSGTPHHNSHGLSLPEALVWRHWAPGGEYTRKLVIKNVSTHAIRFNYKLNQTKVFSMDFPEPVRLSPGMTYALKASLGYGGCGLVPVE